MIEINIKKHLNAASGPMKLSLDLKIETGHFVSIKGPSGAGKTSILRMISGLMLPDEGLIMVDGQTWFDHQKKININPKDRQIGFIWQEYNLFPNMTIYENLIYALANIDNVKTIDELMEVMEITRFRHMKPAQLSGGQKQRVALARALVRKPNLLLLDEPLSAVDDEMRDKLQGHIIQLHKEYSLTTIMVSHDSREIMRMADKVIWLNEGKVDRYDTPYSEIINSHTSNQTYLQGMVIKTLTDKESPHVLVMIGNNLIKVQVNNKKKYSHGEIIRVKNIDSNPIII